MPPASVLRFVAAFAVALWPAAVARDSSILAQVSETCLKRLAVMDGSSQRDSLEALMRGPTWASSHIDLSTVAQADAGCVGVSSADMSPVRMFLAGLGKWLNAGPNHVFLSFALLVLGGLALWSARAFWQLFFTFCLCGIVIALARREASFWGLAPNVASEIVLCLQAASAMAMAVRVGFEGSQVFCGAALGLFAAWCMDDVGGMLGAPTLWYSTGLISGVLALTYWRLRLLAVFAPLIGGAVVVASSASLFARLLALSGVQSLAVLFPSTEKPVLEVLRIMLDPFQLPGVAWFCLLLVMGGTVFALLTFTHFEPWVISASVSGLFICISPLAMTLCHLPLSCPAWMNVGEDFTWLVLGSGVWLGLTTAVVRRQLAMLPEWEAECFWRSGKVLAFIRNWVKNGFGVSKDGFEGELTDNDGWDSPRSRSTEQWNGSPSLQNPFHTRIPPGYLPGPIVGQDGSAAAHPVAAPAGNFDTAVFTAASATQSVFAHAANSAMSALGLDKCCSRDYGPRHVMACPGSFPERPFPPGVM